MAFDSRIRYDHSIMARSFHQNLAHIIFSTKNREPMITAEIESDLHAYLGGIIRELKGTALRINGVADHVHILAKTPKTIADSDFMRTLKANSSGWVKSKHPSMPSFAWQQGYGWFSVSALRITEVEDYIRGQKEHHRKSSFKEEFVIFLKRHGVDYDESRPCRGPVCVRARRHLAT